MEPVSPPTNMPPADEALAQTALEQRVCRLEEKLAAWPETEVLEERIAERLRAQLEITRHPEPVPTENHAADNLLEAASRALPEASVLRTAWLVSELLADIRDLLVLWTDRRYRVTWPTPVLVVLLATLVFTSGWWSPLSWIPFVGWFLDKLLDLLLAFLLFKILIREMRRYRRAVGKVE